MSGTEQVKYPIHSAQLLVKTPTRPVAALTLTVAYISGGIRWIALARNRTDRTVDIDPTPVLAHCCGSQLQVCDNCGWARENDGRICAGCGSNLEVTT